MLSTATHAGAAAALPITWGIHVDMRSRVIIQMDERMAHHDRACGLFFLSVCCAFGALINVLLKMGLIRLAPGYA